MAVPLWVNLAKQRCLVVGGGPVGVRKATTLRDAGAMVRVVCREPPALGGVDWVTEPYTTTHLDGCVLVCAAATPEVNAVVVADALARSLWVNSATAPEMGNITFPATAEQGPIHLAATTHGASPPIARQLVRHLVENLDPTWAAWVELLAELRPLVRATLPNEATRRQVLTQFADPVWRTRLQTEAVEDVREALRALVTEASKR